MKRKNLWFGIRLAAAAALAALACLPASASEAIPTAEPIAQAAPAADLGESAEACLNYTPVQATDEESVLVAALIVADATTAAKPKPCKPCPDQPFCGCKYNGYPRVSCDPCCYVNPYTGQQICLS